MRVKNLKGTTDDKKCPCGIWLDHWINYVGIKNPACVVENCGKKADVGGHVRKGGDDSTAYIVPLCYDHNNQQGAILEIIDRVYENLMVPADSRGKCRQLP